MSRTFTPVYSSTSDGQDLTLCKILESVSTIQSISAFGNAGFNKYFHASSAASTNATLIQSGLSVIGMIAVFHTGSGNSDKFLKIYNHVDVPTASETPIFTYCIHPGDTLSFAVPGGVICPLGLGFRMTSNYADSDNTAVASGELIINISYV